MGTPSSSKRGSLEGSQNRPAEEAVYHVYDVGGRWAVQRDGAIGVMTRTETRDEAVMLARKLAASRGGSGHVIVHRADGSIEAAYPSGGEVRPGSH